MDGTVVKETLHYMSAYYVSVLCEVFYTHYLHYLIQLHQVDYYLHLMSEETKLRDTECLAEDHSVAFCQHHSAKTVLVSVRVLTMTPQGKFQ